MKDTDLIAELRHMKINTKSMACVGCRNDDGCSVHGCNLIGTAADRLAAYEQAVETIKAKHTVASGVGKSFLRDVLSLFDPAYGQPPILPHNIISEPIDKHRNDAVDLIDYAWRVSHPKKRVTDFKLCADAEELETTLRRIDDNGYYLSGVTQDGSGVYTVFFRRPASE